jgi:hypothetical protein
MPTIDPSALFCSKYGSGRYTPQPRTAMTPEERIAANGIGDPLTVEQSIARVRHLAALGYTESIVVNHLLARVEKLEAEIREFRAEQDEVTEYVEELRAAQERERGALAQAQRKRVRIEFVEMALEPSSEGYYWFEIVAGREQEWRYGDRCGGPFPVAEEASAAAVAAGYETPRPPGPDCVRCHGQGRVGPDTWCPVCNGDGWVRPGKTPVQP